MTEMTAFERRVAEGMLHRAGPVRPVDDLAVFDAVIAANRQKGWGFTVFSALKFVVASVIVTLCGGFLLAGLLASPQEGEVLPAAVTESPSLPTVEELLSGMVTEEVEPGVFKVVNDGVRDLSKANDTDIVAGQDGGIWLLRPQRFFRLGGDEEQKWAAGRKATVSDFEVGPDGTIWTIQTPNKEDASTIGSFDGEEWTTHGEVWEARVLEVTPDGTVWAMLGPLHEEVFGHLDEAGWQVLGELPRAKELLVAGPDDVWAIGWEANVFSGHLYRFVDGAWQRWVTMEGAEPTWRPAEDARAEDTEWFGGVAVGPDGTFWGVATFPNLPNLVRFDGSGWSRWPAKETDKSWPAADAWGGGVGGPAALGVAPDGSVWVALVTGSLGEVKACDGVGHFDGLTWDRHLSGLCVEALDISANGSVWLLADSDVYVITPEAVLAAKP